MPNPDFEKVAKKVAASRKVKALPKKVKVQRRKV